MQEILNLPYTMTCQEVSPLKSKTKIFKSEQESGRELLEFHDQKGAFG